MPEDDPSAPASESSLLAWVAAHFGGETARQLEDDAAFLPAGGPWAVTVDHQLQGVHFPAGLDPATVARRALAVNLSDLAAVGAEPAWAFLALAAPVGFSHRAFFAALREECLRHRVTLAGGDLARSSELAVNLTLVGRQVAGGSWVRRAGARPGDQLWVGGTLGESAAGGRLLAAGALWQAGTTQLPRGFPPRLAEPGRRAVRRHLAPEPQLSLGRWLATRPRAAGLDISDGFSLDLHRLLAASGVGAVVESAALPRPPDSQDLAAALGADPLDLVLAGGEDYVLLFALPAEDPPPPEWSAVAVGRLTAGRGAVLRTAAGEAPLEARGWDHLREA